MRPLCGESEDAAYVHLAETPKRMTSFGHAGRVASRGRDHCEPVATFRLPPASSGPPNARDAAVSVERPSFWQTRLSQPDRFCRQPPADPSGEVMNVRGFASLSSLPPSQLGADSIPNRCGATRSNSSGVISDAIARAPCVTE